MPAARAAIASCCFGMSSASAVGSMPIVSAKSSPPSVSATMRRSALAISGMRNQASGVSIMAMILRGADRHAALGLELAHHLGDQADVLRAVRPW